MFDKDPILKKNFVESGNPDDSSDDEGDILIDVSSDESSDDELLNNILPARPVRRQDVAIELQDIVLAVVQHNSDIEDENSDDYYVDEIDVMIARARAYLDPVLPAAAREPADPGVLPVDPELDLPVLHQDSDSEDDASEGSGDSEYYNDWGYPGSGRFEYMLARALANPYIDDPILPARASGIQPVEPENDLSLQHDDDAQEDTSEEDFDDWLSDSSEYERANPWVCDPLVSVSQPEQLSIVAREDGSVELEPSTDKVHDEIYPAEYANEMNAKSESRDKGDVLFDPPLYILRYSFVMNVFEKAEIQFGQLKTVVDLGCSEVKFIKYFRNGRLKTEKLIGVDIDEGLLNSVSRQVQPLVADHLALRENPFEIELLCGSVAEKDNRLYAADGVCAIELIEHLHPEELNKFPETVFGFIQPKICVITTPNQEYNVLFKHFNKQFRHPDHKFEWTRNEFKNWVNVILSTYPEYKVEFHGVGYPDLLQANPEGPCSQIAVFKRDNEAPYREMSAKEEYVSIVKVEYPQELRSLDQRIHDEVIYYSRNVARERRNAEEFNLSESIETVLVPLDDVIEYPSVRKLCADKAKIIEVCSSKGMLFQQEKIVVEFEIENEDLERCEIFGDHQYDPEDGSVFDCPCYKKEEQDV